MQHRFSSIDLDHLARVTGGDGDPGTFAPNDTPDATAASHAPVEARRAFPEARRRTTPHVGW